MRSVEENIDALSRAMLGDAKAEAEQILAEAKAKADAIELGILHYKKIYLKRYNPEKIRITQVSQKDKKNFITIFMFAKH